MVKSSHGANLSMPLFGSQATLAAAPLLTQRTAVNPLQILSAQWTIDPLLLPVGAHVAVISPDEGMAASTYAAARPHWSVIAWVPDMQTVLRGQSLYGSSNLVFDKIQNGVPRTEEMVDAIIAVGWAHQTFSHNQYNLSALMTGLQELLAQLVPHGQLLIQDFALPDDPERFVLIDIEKNEIAQELIAYSSQARPQARKPLQGFFLEALPSPRGGIKRFRLQAKWAVEFFHRWRLGIAHDAPFELTTLALEQWAALAEQCGARAIYRAPQPLRRADKKDHEAIMRFFDEGEKPIPLPSGTFTVLIEKLATHHDAVTVYERRPSGEEPKELILKAAQQQGQDKKTIWIEPTTTYDDVLPWRRDATGEVRVWLQNAVPRPVINAVPRGTPNLDGRRWAGYLTEPLTAPSVAGQLEENTIADLLVELTGCRPENIRGMRQGPVYYAAPEYLAQRVRGIFVEMNDALPDRFHHNPRSDNPGRLVEVMANDVYRALSAGVIPDSKLEILLTALLQSQGDQPSLMGEALHEPSIKDLKFKSRLPLEAKGYATVTENEDLNPFITNDSAQTMRSVRSVFVEDQASPMGRQAARVLEHDFIIPATLSANTAVLVPITRNPFGKFLLGVTPRKLAIPNRLGDDEEMSTMPTFRLPETVTTMDELRAFLAEKLECGIDDFTPFGQSYFVQPHLSPERVYPLLFHPSGSAMRWARWTKPSGNLQDIIRRPAEKNAAYIEAKTQRDMGDWYLGLTPDIMRKVEPVAEKPRNDNHTPSPHTPAPKPE